jgi:hypothetical protein
MTRYRNEDMDHEDYLLLRRRKFDRIMKEKEKTKTTEQPPVDKEKLQKAIEEKQKAVKDQKVIHK